ncbi:MAG: hypothetical protein VCA55_14635 [Verrucomicrobiales bacterium]
MKRFRKILLRVAATLACLGIVALLVLSLIVSSFLDRDAVVGWLEEERNMRVDLGDIKVSLLGGSIGLTGLMMSPRDEYADAGSPVSSRPPAAGSQTRIIIRKMSVKVGLLNLLRRKLVINSVFVDGLEVSFLIERDGKPSLDPLFEEPEIVKGKPNADYHAEKKHSEGEAAGNSQRKDTKGTIEIDGFSVSGIPLATSMESLKVSNAAVYIKIRKNKNRIHITELEASISNLDIDPENLSAHNSAYLEVDARIEVMDRDRLVHYARMSAGTQGNIEPFDSGTGLLNPELVINVTLRKNSEIMSLPIIDRLASTLDKLRKAGLDVSALEGVLVVDNDASVRLGFRDSIVRSLAPWNVGLNGHQLLMKSGSWHNTGSDEHLINADLTFSRKVSDSALGRANKFLADLVGPDLALSVAELLFSPVTRKGRVYVPFVSSGDFNHPKVRPRVKLLDITDAIKGAAVSGSINLPGEHPPDR